MIKKILFLSAVVLFFAACSGDESDVKNDSDTTSVESAEMPEINLSEFDTKAGEFVAL